MKKFISLKFYEIIHAYSSKVLGIYLKGCLSVYCECLGLERFFRFFVKNKLQKGKKF